MSGMRRVGVALVAAAALLVLGPASAQATFPGVDGRIAFASFNDGQIYAVNPDGSGLTQLTHTNQQHIADMPSWSPDGKRILFSRYRADKPFGENDARIWVMNADGTGKARVADDAAGFRDYTPQYTPDARQIVFSRCQPNDGVCAIWKMRADGTHMRALTPYVHSDQNESVDFKPSVSPDGNEIAFGRFLEGGFVARIILMGIDGSNPHSVSPPRLEGFAPDWAPNGHRITFSSNGGRPGSRIFTMRPSGTDLERLTRNRFPHNDFDSVYSPGGGQIAFGTDRNYPDFCCTDLFKMDADGGAEHLLDTGLSSPGVTSPAWGTAPPTP